MDSGHCWEDKKEQKNKFKKPSHACLASAGVQISIFFSAVFTSGLNRLYWEQQALSKTYKTKSTIGSRSKKKKVIGSLEYAAQRGPWEIHKWKKREIVIYTNTWEQEDDGRAAE